MRGRVAAPNDVRLPSHRRFVADPVQDLFARPAAGHCVSPSQVPRIGRLREKHILGAGAGLIFAVAAVAEIVDARPGATPVVSHPGLEGDAREVGEQVVRKVHVTVDPVQDHLSIADRCPPYQRAVGGSDRIGRVGRETVAMNQGRLDR